MFEHVGSRIPLGSVRSPASSASRSLKHTAASLDTRLRWLVQRFGTVQTICRLDLLDRVRLHHDPSAAIMGKDPKPIAPIFQHSKAGHWTIRVAQERIRI